MADAGRRSKGARKLGKRSETDVQYQFTATVLGFQVPPGRGVGHEGRPSLWRVSWKRGEKQGGRSGQVPPQDGAVSFGFDFDFSATLQKKSETRLHKKQVEFIVTEIRPKADGKHEKKGSEGFLNLATLVEGLGLPAPQTVETVLCGKERPVALTVRISGKVKPQLLSVPGQDDDLLTDMPADAMTDMSVQPGGVDLATHVGDLDSLDDDLAGDDDMGYDDEIPAARRQAGSPGRHSAHAVRSTRDFTALEAQLGACESELRTTRKQVERMAAQIAELEQSAQRERARADAAESALKEAKRGSPAAAQQVAESVVLMHGVLATATLAGSREAPPYAVLLRAILRWCALAPSNNPSGSPNTLVCNSASALSAAVVQASTVQAAAHWAGEIWQLLLGLCSQWPQQEVAAALDKGVSRCRADLTSQGPEGITHHPEVLAKEVRVAPVLASSRPSASFAVGVGTTDSGSGAAVIDPLAMDGSVDMSGCDRAVLLGLAAHVAACLAHCLDSVVETASRWCGPGGLAASAHDFFASSAPAHPLPKPPYSAHVSAAESSPSVVEVLPRLHAALLEAGVAEEVCRSVVNEAVQRVDAALFHHLLQTPALCTTPTAVLICERVGLVEGWLREALGYQHAELRRAPPMPYCKQAEKLFLLQGSCVDDDEMWAPLTRAQRHRLLSQLHGDGVAVDQQNLELAARRAAGAQAEVVLPRPVPLPSVLAVLDQRGGPDDWEEEALPGAVAAAAAGLPQLRLLHGDCRSPAVGATAGFI
eukprot:TRINITY_DN2673_c4_g1_i2.p1 TRINITY_DN2673_c4_g1~~TRINITY_DN2673_c4_g1_i2.p1  ORF type:complete len:777 (+),score=271.39 TRINITY_DN2673_c4_g1_i2:41-2332(+)